MSSNNMQPVTTTPKVLTPVALPEGSVPKRYNTTPVPQASIFSRWFPGLFRPSMTSIDGQIGNRQTPTKRLTPETPMSNRASIVGSPTSMVKKNVSKIRRIHRNIRALRMKQIMQISIRHLKSNAFDLLKAVCAFGVCMQLSFMAESMDIIDSSNGLFTRVMLFGCFAIAMAVSLMSSLASRTVATLNSEAVDIDLIASGAETRTVVILRNIPNRLVVEDLVKTFNERQCGFFKHCYLPIDPKRRSNLGYAFVRFHTVNDVVRFYDKFQGFMWNKLTNSTKVSMVIFSKHQSNLDSVETGLRNLISIQGVTWAQRSEYLKGNLVNPPINTPSTSLATTATPQKSNSRFSTPTPTGPPQKQTSFTLRRTPSNNSNFDNRGGATDASVSLPDGAIEPRLRRENSDWNANRNQNSKLLPRRQFTTPNFSTPHSYEADVSAAASVNSQHRRAGTSPTPSFHRTSSFQRSNTPPGKWGELRRTTTMSSDASSTPERQHGGARTPPTNAVIRAPPGLGSLSSLESSSGSFGPGGLLAQSSARRSTPTPTTLDSRATPPRPSLKSTPSWLVRDSENDYTESSTNTPDRASLSMRRTQPIVRKIGSHANLETTTVAPPQPTARHLGRENSFAVNQNENTNFIMSNNQTVDGQDALKKIVEEKGTDVIETFSSKQRRSSITAATSNRRSSITAADKNSLPENEDWTTVPKGGSRRGLFRQSSSSSTPAATPERVQ